MEETLAQIWQDVLAIEPIGRTDNFLELGGHSLLATRIISRIARQCQITLPLPGLFAHGTVADLAQYIQQNQATVGDEAPLITAQTEDMISHPLSFAQEGLWLLAQKHPDDPTFNIPFAYRLNGPLNRSAFAQSLQEIMYRHASLRTTFQIIDGQPTQIIALHPPALIEVDLQHLIPSAQQNAIDQHLIQTTTEAFNLAEGPLIRLKLLRLGTKQHIFILTVHHLVYDEWSHALFLQELQSLYTAFSQGEASPLPDLNLHYSDYAQWQRETNFQNILNYWQKTLQGAEALSLPGDFGHTTFASPKLAEQTQALPPDLVLALKTLSQQEQVTLFMVVLATFQLLLYRYTGQADITLGMASTYRPQLELESVIGFFIHTLPLRLTLDPQMAFQDLLAQMRQRALSAQAHQSLPFEKVAGELALQSSAITPALLQVYCNSLTLADDLSLPDLETISLLPSKANTHYNLSLYVEDISPDLTLRLVYNAHLFKSTTITWLLERLVTLLSSAVAQPTQTLTQLPTFTPSAKLAFRQQCNSLAPSSSYAPFPAEAIEQSIATRFEQQVQNFPDKAAVKTPKLTWTYRQLNEQANQIAHTLLTLCSREEKQIAILFQQDPAMLAGILGTLKSGRAYVPLDTAHPLARLAQIVADAEVKTILFNTTTESLAQDLLVKTDVIGLNIDHLAPEIPTSNPQVDSTLDGLAYILYTSGSTGQPKGVMQNQRNVLHHIRAYTNNLHLSPSDRLSLIPSYAFDAAVMDIFGALLNGATLYPVNIKTDAPEKIMAWLQAEAITVYHSTPTVYRYLLQAKAQNFHWKAVRLVVLGGRTRFAR